MPTPNTTKEVEELLWQVKGDMHNIVGKYNPAFTDKLERHLNKLVTSLTAKHEALDPVRVGMLRQWINEDRIINNPNKKLITNEDIVFWLTPTKTDKQTLN